MVHVWHECRIVHMFARQATTQLGEQEKVSGWRSLTVATRAALKEPNGNEKSWYAYSFLCFGWKR
jgi:hypothetical protein